MIGENINNSVHHIFTTGVYSDYDLKEIQRLQKVVLKKIDKEYDYLSKLRKGHYQKDILKDENTLIEQFNKHGMKIPKQMLYERTYEQIRTNISYICQLIDDSPEQEEGISDYVYEYLYDGNLLDLDKETLVAFSNEICTFAEKMKLKLLNVSNVFEDDDWWDLKDILDKYEVY